MNESWLRWLFYIFFRLTVILLLKRRRQQQKQRPSQVQKRETIIAQNISFHSLTLNINEKSLITVHIKPSSVDKENFLLGYLNEEKFKFISHEFVNENSLKLHFASDISLSIEHQYIEQKSNETKMAYFVHEYILTWSAKNNREKFHDKFTLSNGYWYGGPTQKSVHWPINKYQTKFKPCLCGDAYKGHFGGVCERYWLSSVGIALLVDPLAPLFVSQNTHLELLSKYRTPYRLSVNNKSVRHTFQYRLLQHVNMRDLHLTVINHYLGKPTGTPDHRMIIEPIWSTWANFKQNINTDKILNYAKEIVRRKFPYSQLCIDDDWTNHYGQFEFDKRKFSDPKNMIDQLKQMNFRVTFWIHPFLSIKATKLFIQMWYKGLLINMDLFSSIINLLTERFQILQVVLHDLEQNSYYKSIQLLWPIVKIKQIYNLLPALPGISLWWNGLAGSLDFTNELTCQKYEADLKHLQDKYGIDSFKFDAGEVNWLPPFSKFHNSSCNKIVEQTDNTKFTLGIYPHLYAKLAYRIDSTLRIQEVRVGYSTQTLPIFVRIIDKDSTWTYSNGLKSLLPSVFNLGLLGYPFILPDMVGGNGYGLTIKQTKFPDRQLFIRWMQVNVLLPGIQFSFPPWAYDDEVIQIAHKCLRIRMKYKNELIQMANECVEYGYPMIRPLWFVDSYDSVAQQIDKEYLLGNNILVAPVLEKDVNEIDIYFPHGQWKDIQTEKVYDGRQSYSYRVKIDDIPIFERV
ncbi:unnamed protein product [Didymodactylos carnosus]|uniref:Uncharacterized protein n=1 Tax=Didymodactylos carnosus TaxID=1234261 RepID=A0A813PAB2_9BILA|nr:unnamed protein product [Didymodactylos carnosus]CAF3529249.1 unnamed protein product [Didymodactylos carnosus]